MNKVERKKVLLFGASAHAKKLIEIIKQMGLDLFGFISTEKSESIINGYPVLGNIDFYNKNDSLKKFLYHIAIGENSVRYIIFNSVKNNKENLIKIISEKTFINIKSTIQNGTYISHGVIIQNNANIGQCCLIDTGAIIEHDVLIGDFVNISPGAILCGGVSVKNGAIIGAGATIIEKVEIGENSLVGAGSVVIRDIEPNVIAVGNPARIIKKRNFNDRYLR